LQQAHYQNGFVLRKNSDKVDSFPRFDNHHSRDGDEEDPLEGFQGGLQIGGKIVMNLRYADDSILLATSEEELQELVDRLDRLSRKSSLLINVDKTKVTASDDSVPHTHSE